MQNDYTADFLILGQGLAGTSLAWTLKEAGCTVLVVDRHEPFTSSKVAAGLLTPITGMRISLTSGYAEQLPLAVSFYRRRERALGMKLLHARGHVRLFKNDEEPRRWDARSGDAAVQRFVRKGRGPLVNEAVFSNPRGGFAMKHGGYLDTARYLEASRCAFERAGEWCQGDVKPDDLTDSGDAVEWNGQRFRAAIFCIGWEAANHPLFSWVPFKSARGTILKVRADVGGERRIINHGCWMVAREDGLLRVGATYDTKFTVPDVVPDGDIVELRRRLDVALRVPYEVVESASAVRPIIDRQRVLIGRHPARPGLLFFNGLGSKGTLRAPYVAALLADHLVKSEPIPPGLDLRSNF